VTDKAGAVAPVAGRSGAGPLRLVRRVLLSQYLVLYLTILYVLAIWPLAPEIVTLSNLKEIVLQVLPLFIAALGIMLVLIIAQIDLSISSIMAMSCVVGASVMSSYGGYLGDSPFATPAAILAFLAVGAAIGALNGVCVATFGMPSFLVTLTTMMFFSGGAIWYTAIHTSSGSSIAGLPDAFLNLGYGGLFGVPYALIATILVGFGVHLLLGRTVFGRWLFAVGLNPRAAAISGVPVRRVVIWSFVLSGMLAAVSAIIYTARLEAGTPVLGQRILLDVIGAAVIGGVSLFGGKGKVLWTLLGVLFLTIIDKSLQLLGLSLFSVFAIKGGIILLAAVIDALRYRLLGRQ
jgi:ribose/xylose/arabinose/galactoside ABC-type transport system permease subunit